MAPLIFLHLTVNGRVIKGASTEVKHPQWINVSAFSFKMDSTRESLGSQMRQKPVSFRVAPTEIYPYLMQARVMNDVCEGQFDFVKKGLVIWTLKFQKGRIGTILPAPNASNRSGPNDLIVEMASMAWEYTPSAEVAASIGS